MYLIYITLFKIRCSNIACFWLSLGGGHVPPRPPRTVYGIMSKFERFGFCCIHDELMIDLYQMLFLMKM